MNKTNSQKLLGLSKKQICNIISAKKRRQDNFDNKCILNKNTELFKFVSILESDTKNGILSKELGTLFVVKYDPKGEFKKGFQFVGELDKKFEKRGGTFREVKYLKDKDFRERLNHLSNLMEFRSDRQFGFLTDLDIVDNANIHNDENATLIVNFDLEGAFNQISKNEIYSLFKIVFDLSDNLSEFLSEITTYNGFCYQGNPISPMIFNLLSINLVQRLATVVASDNEGLHISAYADDITISFSNIKWLPKRKQKFFVEIFEQVGWKVNPDKIVVHKFHKVGHNAIITGVNLIREKEGIRVLAGNTRAFKKKLKLFKRIEQRGGTHTKKISKVNKFVEIKQLTKGFSAWIYRKEFTLKANSRNEIAKLCTHTIHRETTLGSKVQLIMEVNSSKNNHKEKSKESLYKIIKKRITTKYKIGRKISPIIRTILNEIDEQLAISKIQAKHISKGFIWNTSFLPF